MRIQTRVVVTVIASLAVTVGVTAFVLAQRARDAMLEEAEANGTAIAEVLARNAVFAEQVMPEVEQSLGEQMVVQATLLAHFVEQAEKAGLSPKEINERLKKVTAMTVLNEIWVTDEKGHAYLHNIEDVDFTFSADPKLQPQASEFYPLLTGTAKTVVQRAMKREIDDRVFKYVGVPGQDKPRIVEVGYEATSLSRLREKVGMPRLVADIVTGHNVLGIRVVDKDLNTKACASVLPGVSTTDCSPQERAVLEGVVRSGVARSTLGEQHLTVFVPILAAGGAVEGAAVVDLPAKNLHQALREAWVASGWVEVGVLLAGVLLAVLLSRWIVGPVTLLTSA
ncbi:MAG: adenylate/guanylate cyclase domain-containing protein, partial [Planctomycetota bacterium]|nr:adenylate/guanylate cyclase domain-containing protein [Planctomycetota bacterium]